MSGRHKEPRRWWDPKHSEPMKVSKSGPAPLSREWYIERYGTETPITEALRRLLPTPVPRAEGRG